MEVGQKIVVWLSAWVERPLSLDEIVFPCYPKGYTSADSPDAA